MRLAEREASYPGNIFERGPVVNQNERSLLTKNKVL